MGERLSDLADALWPHLARRVAGGGGAAAMNVASPTDHGALTGLLDDDHPQYLTAGRGDGRYAALADWTTHIGNADAHHARLHVLATNTGLGSDHTISGATAGHVLRASSATAAAFAQLAHSDLGGVSANQHHNQQHNITGSDHTITANALQVVGATATNTLGLLTPSSNPGAAAAVLASDSSGYLQLVRLGLGRSPSTHTLEAEGGLYINRPAADPYIILARSASPIAQLRASSSALNFTTGDGATVVMVVDTANQKVGIGIDPTYRFDVSGDIRASTSLITPLVTAGAGQSLTLQPPLDLILDPVGDLVRMGAGAAIQASSYASQTTGWRVTDAGEADFRYLFVDEMHAKSFIADLEQALAGGQIIAKSVAVLFSNFTAPAAGATALLVVRDLPSATGMAVFVNGDYVRIRNFSRAGGSLTIGDCWGTVTLDTTYGVSGFDSATKTQRYTFTRSAAPNAGAMAAGTVVYADAIILDYGTTGNGFYEVNAVDGTYGANSPYAQVVTWATHPATQTVRARFGHLRGIFNVADEHGLYAGSGTAVTDRYIRASSSAVELRNVPLALYDGSNNTLLLSAGASNNSPFLAMGSPLPTGPLTNDGIWAGKDGSDYELRAGTVSAGVLTKGLHWDGSQLSIVGSMVVGPGGGFTVANATLHLTFDAPRSAPWQVNLAGHLGQEGSVVSGNVMGEGGKFGGALRLRPALANYINNPSWEVDTAYWTVFNAGVQTRVTTDAVFGDACVSVATGASANPYLFRSDLAGGPGYASGQIWTFSLYVKAGNASAVGKTATMYLREQPGDLVTSAVFTVTGQWQRITVTRTLTNGTPTALGHWIAFTSAGGSGDVFLLDAAQLELNDGASPYIDGSLPGCAWAGTAHNSVSTQATVSRVSYAGTNVPTAGTLMAWIKPVKTSGGYQYFAYYTGSSGFLVLRAIPSSSGLSAFWGSQAISAAGVVNWNAWNHFAVSRDESTTRLYANGVLVASSSAGTALVRHATNPLYLGDTSDPANCWMDDFVLSTDVLSADDIRQVYRSGLPVTCLTSPFEFRLADGTLANITGHSGGIFAVDANGDESFALANGAKVWGTRYSGGSALASGDLVLGDPDQFHLMYDASAATLLIGKGANEHLLASASGLQIKNGSTVYTQLAAGVLTLGDSSNEHALINTSGVALKDGSTVYAQFAATTTIGVTTTEHVAISGTSVQIKDGSSAYTDLTAGVLTLGLVSGGEYLSVDGTNGLRLYGGGTLLGQWTAAGGVVIGEVGNSKSRIEIASGAISIINRSAGGADTTAISLTSAGSASFTGAITAESGSITGVLSVGASGEIRQGSGSLGSNFTGLRIWTDTSVGRIAGYNNNTTQWTAGTDGRMYAGADKLRMDATGVSLLQPAINGAFSETEMTTNAAALRWLPSLFSAWTAASDLSALYAYRETGGNSNDVSIVSRVGSDNYTTRGARVMLQPMLWTGSIFKQANLIASINNTDSQLTWDGTKFVLFGGYMEFQENTTPAAPGANTVILFSRDNGSGKTQLCALFNTGVVQVLAAQP